MTTNEKSFQRFIKEGMDLYTRALESKSTRNTIKHAESCLAKMNNALKISKLLEVKEKLGYIYEYISLSHALIAEAHIQDKDLLGAIEEFKLAKEANTKTLQNNETYIRACYLESELMEIALLQKNWSTVDNFAQNILKMTKKIEDLNRKIKYLQKTVAAFIESKNLPWIKKAYKKLVKLTDKLSEENTAEKTLKARIYQDYGEYVKKVLGKEGKGIEYLEKAKNLYTELHMKTNIEVIDKLIEE